MKEIPLLMKPELVLQTLKGNKTQTRRLRANGAQVGDMFWLKETFYQYGHWHTDERASNKTKYSFFADPDLPIVFEENKPGIICKGYSSVYGWYRRNSLFMEKKFSRCRVEVTAVREQSLWDITRKEAAAEGMCFEDGSILPDWYQKGVWPEIQFQNAWRKLHGDVSWLANPIVTVYEFKLLK